MNRRQRRRVSKLDAAMHRVMAASEQDGKPWRVYGLTGACRDCGATGELHGHGRRGPVRARIWHDPTCPAANGTVPWQPHPIEEQTTERNAR